MGTPSPSRRTDRVLEDAALKVSKAEEALQAYRAQHAIAADKRRQLEEENEKLRQTILSKALQHANPDLRREHAQLRQTLDSFQSKIDQMREISLISARVVDSRIKTKQGRQYVEYKLQIETDIRGTLVLWHRYSTFLNLAATLKAKNPHAEHQIPELQTQSLTGFFSDQLILDRIAKLNEFLDVVTKADEFQWGIRVDKDTVVYKRKSKRGSSGSERMDRSSSGGSRESIALASSVRDSLFISPSRESMMTSGL
ncbi:hypothetical protein P43SY_002610 [Pythium insidiosum]|uniref:PX domain-containing protein n=1 Tax=Pythium insidiosum TaxID=114742 RepID=A0AAD5MJN4_PYTIN|nr:hypothetical protein P43SY_002610 [Pythium insidiosum]KAJ0412742.1 hypothetical protein ATCC90586_002372 [Pythium insidiosum]